MDKRKTMSAMATTVALRSADPSTKVGCIVEAWGTIQGIGCNQFPSGIPVEWWSDRKQKYLGVVHAEINALLDAGNRSRGANMYITHHPCRDCAKVIAAAGIKCVVCPPGPWRDDPEIAASVRDAAEIMKLCGVEVIDAE